MAKVCVIGLGYIGLPTAVVLAKAGHSTLGIDIDPHVVKNVNNGVTHFREPNLNSSLISVVSNGMLRASEKIKDADIFIIAVPTPFRKTNNKNPVPNLDYVISAINSILPFIRKGNSIVIESTCPIGTTAKVKNIIIENTKLKENDFNLAYCPERVIPGNIMVELINNDRVIGSHNNQSKEKIINFYKTFCKGNILSTTAETAEMVKLTENSFRDVNIAFANELSIISDHINIDVIELIKLANFHPRVNILKPGCGVGGHCIAVDPWFIASEVPEKSQLIQTARKINDYKPQWVIEKITKKARELKSTLRKDPIIGCLGITFKPNVDDLRESPALKIVQGLDKTQLKLIVADPNIKSHNELSISPLNNLINNSDLYVFLVAHNEFKYISLKNREYLDFCGVINK
ncbi:UDP-glucose 6-dehydrogenase [Prochlorococcus marinus str. NATL1A]|uniref:UDP-glucose 6-dehydrogenase n=1 Tax=Prochlorococcus marinus (strain NATL1A) TaxID=167555 RepID=A2C1R2_PROM1|nr:UDP-N-acetyl-D-mannosamine dehydrogenase [Prochlorococcus marinus]ABM75422.1 UDP-glucose 6-dehydrogenase [Prochlorococcus marinus str. NATL1A]